MSDTLQAFLLSAARSEHDAGQDIVPSGADAPVLGYVEEGLTLAACGGRAVLRCRHAAA